MIVYACAYAASVLPLAAMMLASVRWLRREQG